MNDTNITHGTITYGKYQQNMSEFKISAVELIAWPGDRHGHHPHREWTKSQKKIRLERRQRS